MTPSKKNTYLLIAVIAALLFIPFLGQAHLFDWDEINFAEAAREMVVTGNYSTVQIDYQPFWEKPPLFFWMQALSMNVFGIGEFAARLPNAICGILTLLFLFQTGSKLFSKKFGIIWAALYAASLLPHFYFKSGIIDPWFNLLIFSGIWYFALYHLEKSKKTRHILISAALIGLATLTKGPVAVLVFGLTALIYYTIHKFKNFIPLKTILLYIIVFIVAGGSWFAIEILNGRFHIVEDFINYQIRLLQTQDAGHGGPFYYHFLVLFFGVFPASHFALPAFLTRSRKSNSRQLEFRKWMLILFWVVLILFSLVRTKIVHYSSLCYFPLSFLGAYGAYYMLKQSVKLRMKTYLRFLIGFTGIITGTLITLLPFAGKNPEILKAITKDPVARASLQANAEWGMEYIIGLILIAAVIAFLVLYKKHKKIAFITLLTGSMITINLSVILYVPKVERYSQGAAVDFYKSIQHEECYVKPYGYKSYAHLFYTRKKPPVPEKSYDMTWLLQGDIDRPAYFVAKITSKDQIREKYPQLKLLKSKNGFLFYKRKKSTP